MHQVETSRTVKVVGNGALVHVKPYICELPSERSKRCKHQESEGDSIMEIMGNMDPDSGDDRGRLLGNSVDRLKPVEKQWMLNCGVILTSVTVVAIIFVVAYLVVVLK